jgi:hypothetical protein
VSHTNTAEFLNASLARYSAFQTTGGGKRFPHATDFKFRNVEMTNITTGDHASNARALTSTDTTKTISPAARKFAEYIARRMRPMIEHAARNNVPKA